MAIMMKYFVALVLAASCLHAQAMMVMPSVGKKKVKSCVKKYTRTSVAPNPYLRKVCVHRPQQLVHA